MYNWNYSDCDNKHSVYDNDKGHLTTITTITYIISHDIP